MKVLSALLLAALVGIALSVCPNGCSGHGTCNAYDECTCQDEGKSTYFGYLYDTAKGYERIKQDAMRKLKEDGATTTLYGMGDSVMLTKQQDERFLAKAAYVQKAWTGADCALKTCPRGVSWSRPYSWMGDKMFLNEADAATNAGAPGFNQCRHADFAECSDMGMCDRGSGECVCFDGYTGAACQRTTCPDDCSGHGQCQSNVEFSKDGSLARVYSVPDVTGTGSSYFVTESSKQVDPRKHYIGAWDSGIQYGCKCDVGFRGESCAMKECPSTADPQGYYGNESGEDCSGRGLCDYSSGECACFSGYTGKDCGTIEALA